MSEVMTRVRLTRAARLAILAAAALLTLPPAACAAQPTTPSVAAEPAQAPLGSQPNPPREFLDTHYVEPRGRVFEVEPDGRATEPNALQKALDLAQAGDVIELRPGGSYTGNFTLPVKSGSGWIVVRSSDDELPDEGTRVTDEALENMPRVLSPNDAPAIATAPGAHGYRFVGIEFGISPDVVTNSGIVVFGSGEQTSLADVPHDLVVDRCYVHGTPSANVRRGVVLNSASSAVVDSRIDEIHSPVEDSQAIIGWNGPGPFKITNNYLEAAGENTMFGGADPRIQDLVPSDIEFRNNYSTKPLEWRIGDPEYAGRDWSIKNLFELKNARRVLVENNLFENNWPDSQNGIAILITVRNQDGTAPWSVVDDVTFDGNTVRHAGGGINILGRDDSNPSEQGERYAIRNNLFDDIGPAGWNSDGRFLVITAGKSVTIDHNTILHTGNVISAYGAPTIDFVYTNNCSRHNDYGIIGDNYGPGNSSLGVYFPDAVVERNVLAGGDPNAYPADNLFPPTLEAAGLVTLGGDGHYHLAPSSTLRRAGLDGDDIGCDLIGVWDDEGSARGGSPEADEEIGREGHHGHEGPGHHHGWGGCEFN